MSRKITILVGTDHHPFERLVVWADQHQTSNPDDLVFVQHGFTRPPDQAQGDSVMTPKDMIALIEESDIVVTHGGPGTIMDVKKAGHRPIVLARNPAHGEHVDQHQMQFADWCEKRDLIRLITEPDQLAPWLEKLGTNGTREMSEASAETAAAVRRFGELVASAPRSSRHRRPVALEAPLVLAAVGSDPAQRSSFGAGLAQARGAVWLGELAQLAEPQASGLRCECGEKLADCATWAALLTESAGSVSNYQKANADLSATPWASARRRHPGRARREELLAQANIVTGIVRAALKLSGAPAAVIAADRDQALGLSHDRHLDLRAVLLGARSASTRLLLRYRLIPVTAPSPQTTSEAVWADLAPEINGLGAPRRRLGTHNSSTLPHPF